MSATTVATVTVTTSTNNNSSNCDMQSTEVCALYHPSIVLTKELYHDVTITEEATVSSDKS